MEERRLDTRFDKGEPYAMALPSPKTTLAARFYRPILTILQCAVTLIPLSMLIKKETSNFSRWLLPSILTIGYIGIYVGRLFFKHHLSKSRWRLSQIILGFFEIIVLITLNILYMFLKIEHESYWWALFILPVYRLAEVGGYREWLGGLIVTSIWLVVKSLPNQFYSERINICTNIAQVFLLTLYTFIPYYIFHVLDLRDIAANFWYPLALRFIKTPPEVSDSKELLHDVFLKGMVNLITADFGKLWELDVQKHTLILNTVDEYKPKRPFDSFWQKWMHKKENEIPEVTEPTLLANSIIQEQRKLSPDQRFIAHSKNDVCQADLPWYTCKDKNLNSWLVAPIYTGNVRRPVGYLEVGKYEKLNIRRWQVIESQMIAITEVLGAVHKRIQQVQADELRTQLTDLEQEVPDEATLYTLSSKAMLNYFHRPILIVNYSLATGKIETYAGDYEPKKVEQLANSLQIHDQELLRLEEADIHLIPSEASQSDRTYYFVCRLSSRKTQIETIILGILSIIRGRHAPAEGICRKWQIQVHCATYVSRS